MTVEEILEIIAAIEKLVSLVSTAKTALEATDQATVDAALSSMLATEASDYDQAVKDGESAAAS